MRPHNVEIVELLIGFVGGWDYPANGVSGNYQEFSVRVIFQIRENRADRVWENEVVIIPKYNM